MAIFSQASAKNKTKRLTDVKFPNFIGQLSSSDIVAVKGLNQECVVLAICTYIDRVIV